MNVFALLAMSLTLPLITNGQHPVEWSFTAKKITDKTYEIHANARIKKSWHIYSQHSPVDGALPTKLTLTKNPLIITEGKPAEIGKLVSKYEDVFDTTVQYFEDAADFVQRIKLKYSAKTLATGSVTYMVCNDHQCLPPKTIPFTILVP